MSFYYTLSRIILKPLPEPQDAQGDDDLDSIDADAFMAEIDETKKEKAKASSSKSAQKLVRNLISFTFILKPFSLCLAQNLQKQASC
jgi:hypothetical protein